MRCLDLVRLLRLQIPKIIFKAETIETLILTVERFILEAAISENSKLATRITVHTIQTLPDGLWMSPKT